VRTLTVVLTHVGAEHTDELMSLLQAVAPDARFVVAHGGTRRAFDQITWEEKLFVDDPTLRGPPQHLQSLTQVLETAWRAYFDSDAALDSLYLIEYDHLILDGGFEARLRTLAQATQADLLGKACIDATGTNLAHYVRFRRDDRLLAHLAAVSVREDRQRLFSCLGDGIWLSRRALAAYVDVGEHPPCYCEIYVPTLIHHLGLRVVDVDAHGDLYRDVRWTPEFSASEVLDRASAGAVFVHPVKQQAVITPLRERLASRRIATMVADRPPEIGTR
jgi:hypothetical protein